MPVDQVNKTTAVVATVNNQEISKVQLKQLKKDLKDFEHQFFNSEGRKPGKADIVSNKEIAKKYKLYAKYKAQFESSAKETEEDPIIEDANNNNEKVPALKLTSVAPEQKDTTPKVKLTEPSIVKQAVSPGPNTPVGTKGFDFLEDLPENFKLSKHSQIEVLKSPVKATVHGESSKADLFVNQPEASSPAVAEFLSRKKELEKLSEASPASVDKNEDESPTEQPPEKAPPVTEPNIVQSHEQAPVEESGSDSSDSDSETPVAEPIQPKSTLETAVPHDNVEKSRTGLNDEAQANAKNIITPSATSPTSPKGATSVSDEAVGESASRQILAASATPTGSQSEFQLGSAEKRSPVPAAGSAALAGAAATFDKDKVKRAADKLNSSAAALKVASEMITDPKLFQRLPRKGILRCRVYRKTSLFDMSHPTFYLYNEADEKFLMAARKRVKSKNINYIISSSHDELTKNSTHYIAKLKANPSRTQFVLFDARGYNDHAPAKGLRELAAVSYSKTVLPREMQAVIPATNIPEDSDQLSKDVLEDMRIRNGDKLLFLRNKPPRWNESTQTHCLNFGGRVTMPSIKNFQLINENDESVILMQFGRTGPDLFTLDVRYPLTPIEAFSFALSTFDAYDST